MEPAVEGGAEMLAGPDPELAATMGFSDFGKKARTFDLEAMFEQTRTAVERSRKILETACSEREGSSDDELTSPSMQSQTSARGPAEDTDDDEFIGPPLPPGFKDSDDNNDNDDTEEEDNVFCSSSMF